MEAVPPPTSSAEAVSSTVHMAPPSSSSAHSLSSSASSLQDLHNLLVLPNNSWCDQTSFPLTAIKLCKISCQPTCSKQPLVVTHCLTVNDSLHWSLFVHDHEVKQGSCAALASIPPQLNAIEFSHLLDMIDRLHVCSGHPDDHFVSMVSSKKGVLKSCSGSTAAILDSFAPVQLNGEHFSETVRTSACELLVHESKCPSCKSYRAVLRAMYSRYNSRDSSKITETTSHTNERYLNTPEKKNKMEKMKKRVRMAESEVQKLKKKVAQLTDDQGDTVDCTLHDDLVSIMNEKSDEIRQAYPEGSFSRLLWDQQLQAAQINDSRQVRWHPLIIRWCLNLKLISSAAYHAMKSAGFIKLPSERTLRDYTHVFESKTGFQPEVNDQLHKESNLSELAEEKKWCGLILDEMKVKQNLVYNKFTGAVIGFTNLGSINDELLQLEHDCQADEPHTSVATQLLVVMVRGIFFKLDFPYAHFATKGVTADLLFPIVWEAIRRVETIGLKVIFITADGASSNRKFFRMHKGPADTSPVYKTVNRYSGSARRPIFFFSDPPHLIKTARNCWSHSAWNGSRLMTVGLQ